VQNKHVHHMTRYIQALDLINFWTRNELWTHH